MTRHITFTLFFLFVTTFVFSQASVTYDIETLTKPNTLVKEKPKQEILKFFYGDIEKTSLLPDSLAYLGEHPFLNGISTAYKEHRPFVISPDIIWLLISQGFARHITNNADELRNDFVNFQGKKVLTVVAKDIIMGRPDNNWEQVFPQFTQQIADNTSKELVDVLTADFSTTTSITKISSQITVMESLKPYFDYKVVVTSCGIPKITIEGTTADWEKILQKTQYLSKYKLDWWTSELEPILKEIINATKGNFKKEFWMNMVKAHTEKIYGSPTTIDGWIVKFFPYTEKGERRKLEPIKGIGSLPSEIVRVPFIAEDPTIDKQYKMEFYAGFVGLTQNKNDFTLKPEIAWIVSHKIERPVNDNHLQ